MIPSVESYDCPICNEITYRVPGQSGLLYCSVCRIREIDRALDAAKTQEQWEAVLLKYYPEVFGKPKWAFFNSEGAGK